MATYGSYLYSPEDQYAKFGQEESNWAQGAGNIAANLADPFAKQRPQYQTMLSDLMKNPGNVTTSPYYKFLVDEALNQTQARAAAMGLNNSGRRLAALSDRAQGAASQAFFPLAKLYSNLAGVNEGSPAAAGGLYLRGSERGQDYRAIRDANRYGTSSGGGQPWWMDPSIFADPYFTGGRGGGGGLPSGGYGGGGYTGGTLSNIYNGREDTIGVDPFGTDYMAPPEEALGYEDFFDDYGNFMDDSTFSDDFGYGDYSDFGDFSDYGYFE